MSYALKLKDTLFKAFMLRFVTLGLDLLFFGYILKRLPVDEVGFYSWVIAVVMFVGLFLDLGVDYVLVRDISSGQDSKKALLGSAGMRGPVIVAVIGVYLAWYWSGISDEVVYRCVLYMGIATAIGYFERILIAYLRAREWQTTSNSLQAFNSLLRVSAGIYVLDVAGSQSALVLIEGLLAAKLVSMVVVSSVFSLVRRKLKPTEPEGARFNFRAHLKSSLTMLGMLVLSVIQSRADWLMIERWVSKEALANYALSNMVLEVNAQTWITALQTMYPWLCRQFGTDEPAGNYSLFYGLSVFAGVLVGFATCVFAPYLVFAVFGDKYASAIPTLKVHAIAFSVSSVITLLYYSLVAQGLEKQLFKFSGIYITIQIVLDVLLIRSYGIVSAAFAMLVSYLVCLAMYVWYADRRKLVVLREQKRLLFPMAVLLCLLAVLHMDMSVWLKLIVFSAGSYFTVIRLYLNGEERAYVFKLIRGKRADFSP